MECKKQKVSSLNSIVDFCYFLRRDRLPYTFKFNEQDSLLKDKNFILRSAS